MAGTLKSQITPQTVANDIIMQWKSPGLANKVLVLVEGKNDYVFYFKFFDQSTAEIKDCNGCKGVVTVYQCLQQNANFKNISIKDSDFERLNGNLPPYPNLFYADGHDYEMMCLKNSNTIKKLFELKTQKAFEDNITKNVKTRAEKAFLMNAIQTLGLNDFTKIAFCIKYTGINI